MAGGTLSSGVGTMLRSLGSRHHGVFGRGLSTASKGGGGGGGGGAFVFGGVLALGTVGGLYVFRRDGNIRDQMLAVSPVFGQLEGAISRPLSPLEAFRNLSIFLSRAGKDGS